MLLDVLSGLPELKLCTAYDLDGERTAHFPSDAHGLASRGQETTGLSVQTRGSLAVLAGEGGLVFGTRVAGGRGPEVLRSLLP